MAKAKTSEWDATASGNTEIDGINISEGCPAANVNDAIREIMSQVADARTGSDDGMVTGTAGTNNHLAKWNADGDLISASVTLSGSDSTVITGTAGGDNEIAKWNADGDLVIRGTLTTGGPTCDGGCDAVFTERRIIPEDDYAARMWADGHLPFVGPTAPEAPINVSEKLGGMLNALEHAHVFIERQNRRIETLEAEKAAQDTRIARLEARLMALETSRTTD